MGFLSKLLQGSKILDSPFRYGRMSRDETARKNSYMKQIQSLKTFFREPVIHQACHSLIHGLYSDRNLVVIYLEILKACQRIALS